MKYLEELGIFLVATVIIIIMFVCSGTFLSESGCSVSDSLKADYELKSVLITCQGDLQNDLMALSEIAGDTAVYLSGEDLCGENAQNAIDSAQKKLPGIVTVGIIDRKGIVTAMSPSSHEGIVGSDLSQTPVVSGMNAGMVPLMTDMFELTEGGSAASINYPVFSPDRDYTGFVSLTFDPSLIIEKYASGVMNETGFQLMGVQKNGVVLYDTDPAEIGKETFGNHMYDNFPEIREFANAYSQSFSGEYKYSYLDKNLEETVIKKAFWTTFGLYGSEWRIIVIREM